MLFGWNGMAREETRPSGALNCAWTFSFRYPTSSRLVKEPGKTISPQPIGIQSATIPNPLRS